LSKRTRIAIAIIAVIGVVTSVWTLTSTEDKAESISYIQVFQNNGGAISGRLVRSAEHLEPIYISESRTTYEVALDGVSDPIERDRQLAIELQNLEARREPLIALTAVYSDGCLVSFTVVLSESEKYEYRGRSWPILLCSSERAVRITL